jgi:hypothetical protein
MQKRKLIALCGAPKAGKSEVQKYLQEKYQVVPVDDGRPLRDFAYSHLGLGWDDVTTQAGKAKTVILPGGQPMNVREILGGIGNALEKVFGDDILIHMALNHIRHAAGDAFCFSSVRRSQAAVIRREGGLVIGIERPGCPIVHDFDHFDQALVDMWIHNTGTTADLHQKVDDAVRTYLNN